MIALPAAFYIAKVAQPWARRGLDRRRADAAVGRLPRQGLRLEGDAAPGVGEFGVDKDGGVLEAVFGWTPGFGYVAVVLALTYLWLPYMVLPIYAGLERLPQSLLEASGDLGARPWRTFRSGGRADAHPVDRRRQRSSRSRCRSATTSCRDSSPRDR